MQDLKAEDLNGLSDPVVYVEIRGEKQHTKVMKERVSCVFDDLFFYNFRNLSVEEFEDTQIKVGGKLVYRCHDFPSLSHTRNPVSEARALPIILN